MGKSIWEWLEIEPTSDVNVIKAAYAEASKKYHPAEHPEEFKRLRDSYKVAISLAKSMGEKQVSENSYSYAEFDSDESESGDKYNFDIDKERTDEEKEDSDTSKYDFSSVVYDDSFSDRQKRMISLFGRMMSFVQTDPACYGHEKVIKTIMYNWDKSPYKEEITPVFIERILNVLSEVKELGAGAADAMEKVLFTDSSNSQIGALHSRFRSVFTNINTCGTGASFIAEDVKNCFCRLLKYPTPIIHSGITYGEKMPYSMSTKILPIREILLFHDAENVRYYFAEELSYSVDAKTDRLTVYDYNNDTILKMNSGNANYSYLLDHLVQNGSRYTGGKNTDETGAIAMIEDYSTFWGKIGFYGVVTTLFSVFLGIFFFLYSFTKDLEKTEYYWFNDCMLSLFVICGIALLAFYRTGAGMKLRDRKFISACKKRRREFQSDIRNKDAEYVLGSEFYIFKRYIVFFAVDRGYIVLPIEDIWDLGCESKAEGDLTPRLVIKHYNGTAYYCRLYPCAVIEKVIEIVNRKKEEAKA